MLIPDKDVLNTHSLIFVSIMPVCIGIVTFGMDFKEQLVQYCECSYTVIN